MSGLLLFVILLQSPDVDQGCSITGHVYSADTGAPLKDARVRLTGPGVTPRLSGVANFTDAEGGFRFGHLGPGQYSLFADRSGYLNYSVWRVSCGPGDVTVRMMLPGKIYGRVVDDNGEPSGSAVVSLYKRIWIRGQRQLEKIQNTVSEADGTFVIDNLASERYYLSVKGAIRPPRGEAPIEMFFPNTADAQSAAAVSVISGAEVRGIDLLIRTKRVYNIRGKAVGATGELLNGIALVLNNVVGPNRGSITHSAITGDGDFEFQNVAPGNYVIEARPILNGDDVTHRSLTAYFPVTVYEADLENVLVKLSPGPDILGIVRLDNKSFLKSFIVMLEPLNDEVDALYQAEVKDGAFSIRDVSLTSFHVATLNLPEGHYVKSMRLGDRDLPRHQLDLSFGAKGTLEIQLSTKPASITGTLRNSDGESIANAIVSVWKKDDPEIRSTRTDAIGHYSLRDVAPGEYRVIGWEDIEPGLVENPAFRASFESQARQVTLHEGSQEVADPKLVLKAAVDAEVARLP